MWWHARFEHDAALVAAQISLITWPAIIMAHIRMDLIDVSQPSFADRFLAQLHRRIVAKHIPHLKRQIPLFASVEQLFEQLEVFASRFIHVHCKILLHAPNRSGHQIGIWRFNQNSPKAWEY